MLKTYLKRIFDVAKRGDATEPSYYSSLEELLKNYAASINRKKIDVTTIPKKTEAGSPDFRIWHGKQDMVGYIEAKKPTEDYLDNIEKTKQWKRYLKSFPNIILTNFLEFRLFRDGNLIDKVRIAKPFAVHKLRTAPGVENEEEFLKLLNKFFKFSIPKTYTAKSLAIELADKTRYLKDQVIAEELKEENEKNKGNILGFYKAFQTYLIGTLTQEKFADLYSQTITYGLFVARTRTDNGFNRKLAFDKIPPTIGILRDVFKFISLGELPTLMEWIVDDISDILASTDVQKILQDFYHERKGKDPIVHFYETFLAEYDPKEREQRGVYYTPEPVVSYIVHSLHSILKQRFAKDEGFASSSVTVLDPAAGTLTFLAEASKLALQEFTNQYGESGKKNLINEHILKNFYALEIMMAPYAVGHLKMSILLEEFGYKLKNDDRFKLYLTNTLEMEDLEQSDFPGMSSLAEESHLAGKVKKQKPILVLLGNPPYSGHSFNPSEVWETYVQIQKKGKGKKRKRKKKTWIGNRIEDYKIVDGKKLEEKNPKWLQNDYVKFIRFAQWKIDQAGEGILGFITSHSYLDSPTFRGMRQSLMKSFNEIYLLDLHGDIRKKEKCPDGSKDENVFDIRQGVAIGIFIKERGKKKKTRIQHYEKWGLREDKNNWLLENDINTTKWKEINPKSEFYLFTPREGKQSDLYQRYIKVTGIFSINNVGITTARDKFVIDSNKDFLKGRIMEFRNKRLSDESIKENFKLKDKSNWKLKTKREKIINDKNWEGAITKILYRPFDIRWIFYHDDVVERSRREVMRHMMQENLGLITNRQVNREFRHAICSSVLINDCTVSLESRERSYLFPLYLYPDIDKTRLFSQLKKYREKKPNLNPALVKLLNSAYAKEAKPEEIFFYIYAILYSNTYRTKYAEDLKIDFPRVPFTKDFTLFQKMSMLGKELIDLHLLKARVLGNPISKCEGDGTNLVEKLRYNEKERRIYFNKSQYFKTVEKDVWEYQIGGYQVCDKWLKDRKGGNLTLEDIRHYCKMVTALKKTIGIQQEIDKFYPQVEKKLIDDSNKQEKGL